MARFQELECWQEAAALAVEVYALTSSGTFRHDYGLCDQLRRSAISVASNIAEGKERETVSELVRYLYIAKGSAGELWTQLHIAGRVGFLEGERARDLETRVTKVRAMLGAFIKVLKNTKQA